MNLLKLLGAVAIASLLATPAYAAPAANPAAKLSLAPASASASASASKAQPAGEQPDSRSTAKSPKSMTLPLIAIGAAVIVGAAVLLGSSDSEPASN